MPLGIRASELGVPWSLPLLRELATMCELVPGRLVCEPSCCLSLDWGGGPPKDEGGPLGWPAGVTLRDCCTRCARLRIAKWVLRCAAVRSLALFVGLLGQLLVGVTVTTVDAVLVQPGVRLREEPQAEIAEFVLQNVGVVLLVCGMKLVLDGVVLL